jgi:hypothetical protein
MSDAPQGPDWWQASDDRWYPPPRPDVPTQPAAQQPGTGSGESAAQQDPTIMDSVLPANQGPLLDPTVQEAAGPQPAADPTLVHPYASPPVAPTGPPTAPPVAPTAAYGVPGSGGWPAGSGATAPPLAPPNAPGGVVPPSGGYPLAGAPSPYASPPAPSGGSQTRTPLLITLAIVVVVAIVAAIAVASSGGDDQTAGSTTSSPSTTGGGDSTGTSERPDDSSTTTTGGGGAGTSDAPYPSGHEDLQIVDQGFSVSTDESAGVDTLSYGALVENTGDRVAVVCSIATNFSDDSGSPVAVHDSAWLSAILPGQTFGIGISGLPVDGEPAGMQVDLGDITWDDPASYGEITVETGATALDSYGRPTTTFGAESSYDDELSEPFGWVVHRNADGDIVGGDGDYLDQPLVPGEPVDDEITTTGPVADADEAGAEVWIEPVTTDCQSDQPGEPDPAGEIEEPGSAGSPA